MAAGEMRSGEKRPNVLHQGLPDGLEEIFNHLAWIWGNNLWVYARSACVPHTQQLARDSEVVPEWRQVEGLDSDRVQSCPCVKLRGIPVDFWRRFLLCLPLTHFLPSANV